MKNYVQPGDMITFTAAADITSGAGVLVGSLFGVAAGSYLSGATDCEMKTTGVFDLAADPAATATVGAKAYWDGTEKRVTATVGTNTLIGCFVLAKVASTATARVRLNGVA